MKKLLILGASILQLPAILKARDLGIYTIVIDADSQAIGFKYADEAHIISTIDTRRILNLAIKKNIDGIMTLATDMPMRSVAFVANKLGLNGVSLNTADLATNKYKMRKRLSLNKIPIPKFFKVNNYEDFKKVTSLFESRYIVKPVDSSGSRGIYLVRSSNEMEKAFYHAKQYSDCGDILVEEFMTGSEVSVETISINGQVNILAITDKLTTGAPYFVEMGHSQPTHLDDRIIEKISKVAAEGILALGIVDGPSHTEIKITKEGPKIVEIGARLGGGCITSHLVPLSTGIDMIECCILISLGETPEVVKKINRGSAIRFFNTHAGQILSITGTKETSLMEGIKEVTFIKHPGDIINNIKNGTDRIGWVIADGENATEAVAICEKALKMVNIIIKDVNK